MNRGMKPVAHDIKGVIGIILIAILALLLIIVLMRMFS
jgi:hypothetical protein